MFFPTSASSTIFPVMMLGSSPSTAESRMVRNTSRNCGQYGTRYERIRLISVPFTTGMFCFSSSVRKPLGPSPRPGGIASRPLRKDAFILEKDPAAVKCETVNNCRFSGRFSRILWHLTIDAVKRIRYTESSSVRDPEDPAARKGHRIPIFLLSIGGY